MENINRIERWDENMNHDFMESEHIGMLYHLTRLSSIPFAYGVDFILYTKSDCDKASNLIKKIKETLDD